MQFKGRTRRALTLRAAFAALVAAAACGPFHMGSRDRAVMVFTNDTMDQADVYATIGGSQTVRIGTVFATRTDTLTVPSSVTDQGGGQTNIIARLLAHSYQPSTGLISLHAEDVIHVRLASDGRALFVTPGR